MNEKNELNKEEIEEKENVQASDENKQPADGGVQSPDEGVPDTKSEDNQEVVDGSDKSNDDKDAVENKALLNKSAQQAVNRRIGQLVKQKKELEEKLKSLSSSDTNSKYSNMPSRSDFESDEEFLEAKIEYFVNRREADMLEQERLRLEKLKNEQKEQLKTSLIERGSKKFKDFNDVVLKSTHPIFADENMVDALILSENGDEIAYFLAKNPTEASRIADLPMAKALSEIGRLEAKILASRKTKSDSPEPTKKVVDDNIYVRQHSYSLSELAKMSQSEYEKARKEMGYRPPSY